MSGGVSNEFEHRMEWGGAKWTMGVAGSGVRDHRKQLAWNVGISECEMWQGLSVGVTGWQGLESREKGERSRSLEWVSVGSRCSGVRV